ncbi:c-type cytochrome [Thalassotalea litorea]|uniref:c-type cytochrome n=1 Tax=Thalassotalea litorea TaxID=2020715 RepID=UPI003736A058
MNRQGIALYGAFTRMTAASLFLFSGLTLANNVENQSEDTRQNRLLTTLSQNPTVTAQGQTLFEQVCASCHGKDLSGGSGFNLKDGEWVHGSQPSAILANIETGFMKAGMPGFKDVFNAEQLQSIVAYILSQRRGFDGLTYKLYQMQSKDDRTITDDKLVKSGTLSKNLADFQLPEIQHYIIEFSGDFYTSGDEDTRIWIQWGAKADIDFEVDGKPVARDNRFGEWFPTWVVARGKQTLKITYRSADSKPGQRNLVLIATNDDMSIKKFALSTRAQKIMLNKKFNLNAEGETLVQRIKVTNLPAYSISVATPKQINHAFNTRSCDIVGLWQGEFLNIGPNIGGRGEDASIPLGDWVFHSPQALTFDTQENCRFKGYQMQHGEPVFRYTQGSHQVQVSAKAVTSKQLDIHYQVTGTAGEELTIRLPKSPKLTWNVPGENMPETSDEKDYTMQRVKLNDKGSASFLVSAQIHPM